MNTDYGVTVYVVSEAEDPDVTPNFTQTLCGIPEQSGRISPQIIDVCSFNFSYANGVDMKTCLNGNDFNN